MTETQSFAALQADYAALKNKHEAYVAEVEYFLQNDKCNSLTPRVIDLAYTAFMQRAMGKNQEDGGPCDWFNDTQPKINRGIALILKTLEKLK